MATSVQSTTQGTISFTQGNLGTSVDGANGLGLYWQSELSNTIFIYLSPVILIVGLLGNSFNLIVLQSKSMRSAATSFLLSALAVSDMGCLLTTLLNQWLRIFTDFTVNMRAHNIHTCRVHYFPTFLCHHLSTMTLSFLTIQRAISVYLPLKAKIICSHGNTIKVWTGIAILLAGFNSIAFFTMTFESDYTFYKSCFYSDKVRSWFNLVEGF